MTTWRREPCGGGVVLHAPDSSDWVRIRPRVAGLPNLGALVEAHGGRAREAEIESLRTVDGELALHALAPVPDGWLCAAVTASEPFACIESVSESADRARRRALRSPLGVGLGFTRQRPFLYRPPPDWLGIRRPGVSHWLAPAHPVTPGSLAVFDARPHSRHENGASLERRLFIQFAETLKARDDLGVLDCETDAGLEGRLHIARGKDAAQRTVIRAAATAIDDSFLYLARIEGPDRPWVVQTLEHVLASFRPIARPVASGAHEPWSC